MRGRKQTTKSNTMRTINHIFVHCTATPPTATIDSIRAGWKAQGWTKPGYHYLVTRDGGVHQLYPVESPTNGVKGFNAHAIHVAYMGGLDATGKGADTRTADQRHALRTLLRTLHRMHPVARIMGHRDIWGRHPWQWHKECPCFDAEAEYSSL